MRFKICNPDYDDTVWHEVESTDPEAAAESYAGDLCARDPECFSTFEGDGLVLLVRGASGTVPVKVTAELVPTYSARRVT